ncbi:hypothetical protein Plec18170_002370 [Paecilomyces lecythidis]
MWERPAQRESLRSTQPIGLSSNISPETGSDSENNDELNQPQSSRELVDMLADSISEFEVLQNRMLDVMERHLKTQVKFENGSDDGLTTSHADGLTCKEDKQSYGFEDRKKRFEELMALRERTGVASAENESGENITPQHV